MRLGRGRGTVYSMHMSSNTARALRLVIALAVVIASIWIVFNSVKSTLPTVGDSTDVVALQKYAKAVSSGNYEQALIESAGLRQGVDNGVAKVLYPVDPLTCLAIDMPKYRASTSLSVVRVSPLVCKGSVAVVVVKPGS